MRAGDPDAVRFLAPMSWSDFAEYTKHLPTNDLVDRLTKVGANALRFQKLYGSISEDFEKALDDFCQESLDELIYGQSQAINNDGMFTLDFWETYIGALNHRKRLKKQFADAYTDLVGSFKDPVIAELASQTPKTFGDWWSDMVYEHEHYDVIKSANGQNSIEGGLFSMLIPRIERRLPAALRCRLVLKVESSPDPVELCQIFQSRIEWSEFGNMYMEMESRQYPSPHMSIDEFEFLNNDQPVWPDEQMVIRPKPSEEVDAPGGIDAEMQGLDLNVEESMEKDDEDL